MLYVAGLTPLGVRDSKLILRDESVNAHPQRPELSWFMHCPNQAASAALFGSGNLFQARDPGTIVGTLNEKKPSLGGPTTPSAWSMPMTAPVAAMIAVPTAAFATPLTAPAAARNPMRVLVKTCVTLIGPAPTLAGLKRP